MTSVQLLCVLLRLSSIDAIFQCELILLFAVLRAFCHVCRTGLQTLGELDVDDDEENIASSQVLHTSSNAAPSATNPTSAGGAVPEPLSAPDELVALGEDLLTAEDIDAFLDFDDDDTGDAGGAETDVPTGPDQLGDVVEDFSDDDSW